MREVYIVCVPGTSEVADGPTVIPKAIGMLAGITNKLPARLDDVVFRVVTLPYPAAYGDKMAYTSSVERGKARLKTFLTRLPLGSRVILLGYSQGCDIAGSVYYEFDTGKAEMLVPNEYRILGYIGVSDPYRNPGQVRGTDPGGQGILLKPGGRRQWSKRAQVFQYAAPGDIISSSDPNTDLFYEASQFTNELFIGNVLAWAGYALARVQDPVFQRDLSKKYSGINGYLKFRSKFKRTLQRGTHYIASQVHVKYGQYRIEPGGLMAFDDAAMSIQELVEDGFNL